MRRSQPGNSKNAAVRAVIITGGDIDRDHVKGLLDSDPGACIIAVEKGYRFCLENEIEADLVIGDFDTLGDGYAKKAKALGTECIKLPPEKDQSDTYAAVAEAVKRGCTNITVTGCFGGREDHSIANIKMLHEMSVNHPECDIVLNDRKNKVRILTGEQCINRDDVKGYISFFAAGGPVKGLTLKGFKYELEGYTLESYSQLCVSNEIAENRAFVSFDEGTLIEVISED